MTLFVHITFKLLAGRNVGQKQQLSQQLFDAVKVCSEPEIALSVDIQDMDKDCYRKCITCKHKNNGKINENVIFNKKYRLMSYL